MKQLQQKQNQKGSVTALILVVAAFLGVFSLGLVYMSKTSMKVNQEKQLLDSQAVILGKTAIQAGNANTCSNGLFIGDMSNHAHQLFAQMQENQNDRQMTCVDEGLVVRDHDGPDGPKGSYRRYRLSSSYQYQAAGVGNAQGQDPTRRETIVEIKEINGTVEQRKPKVVFVLDYSGSMSTNNRRGQLINAVKTFISGDFDMDYGVVLFSSNVLQPSVNINRGAGHNADVVRRIDGQPAGGSTNYSAPIGVAANMLRQQDSQELYIIFVSDGFPNEGAEPVGFVNQNIRNVGAPACINKNGPEKCITIYTLGVEDASFEKMVAISGNAATPANQRSQYYREARANQVTAAFNEIIANILCKYGPINPAPTQKERSNMTVHLNNMVLKTSDDFEYNAATNEIQFFDEACDHILENGGNITIRYGEPRLIINQ